MNGRKNAFPLKVTEQWNTLSTKIWDHDILLYCMESKNKAIIIIIIKTMWTDSLK